MFGGKTSSVALAIVIVVNVSILTYIRRECCLAEGGEEGKTSTKMIPFDFSRDHKFYKCAVDVVVGVLIHPHNRCAKCERIAF